MCRRPAIVSGARGMAALFRVLVPLLAATAALAGGGDVPNPIPSSLERAAVRKNEGHRLPSPAASTEVAGIEGASVGVDALHYTLDLTFNAQSKTISGSVTGQFETLSAGLTALVLNFYDNMIVSGVTLGGLPLAFTHASNVLTITLDRPYATGEIFEVAVSYSGSPANTGFGSFTWSSHRGDPIFASLSEPTYGPTWWPSVDDPGDKVTADMIFTVKNTLVAASNGTLISTTPKSGAMTEYHWQETYPIAPYLISIACTNYSTITQSYTPLAGGSPMLVRHWVYPEHLTEAQGSFAVVPSMIGTLAGLFGEYPFLAEKYGMAIFTFSGGMEHQTATSYGANLVTGTNSFEWIIAHEMSHQWWGDSLTLDDWRETWLHEGFATYSEALYFEVLNGAAYYHSYMNSLDGGSFSGPVYDNPNPFGSTVYDKGAWVVHMLRHVIGDAAFFDLLPSYHAAHAYGNVSTTDFRLAAETEWGQDLAWFFDEWVYGAGRPAYQWGWLAAEAPPGYVVHVRIDQTQAGAPYTMPLDVRVVTPSGTVDAVVWNDGTTHDFAIPVPEAPTSVSLDPDNWVLNAAAIVTLPDGDGDNVPDTADNCPGLLNPAQADLDGDGIGDPCDPDADGDGVLNGSDCGPMDPGAFSAPAEVALLSIDDADLSWSDLSSQAGPGVLYDVLRGDAGTLSIDGGIGGAACHGPGLPGLAASHGPPPAPGGIQYFLARGRNVCGSGSYGFDSAGNARLSTACP